MSVKYKVVPKGKPGVLGGGEIKYYASIVRGEKVNLRTFLLEMDKLKTVHKGAFLAVLESFLDKVHEHLVNGRAVDLGQLGIFYPAISSSSAESPDDVRRESIRRFKVNFRPSALLQDELDRVKFEKITNEAIQAPTP